ncbi:unnamed protein product [Blepharisma stoltei]|uniref:histidine kinase n=1 Tax=Blepharisma stoltei TaxID=1481888 RepID=A0AAU9K760_9CILI|nr:unnamed protein product [Blepharisma stoltei]
MEENSYILWWEDEVNQRFAIFKKYMTSSKSTFAIFWTLYLVMTPQNIMIFVNALPYIILQYTFIFVMYLIESKNAHKKYWLPVVYTEWCDSALWYYSLIINSNNPILFEMLGSLLMGYFELPFIQSKIIQNFILAKHVILWHYYKYFTGDVIDSQDLLGHIMMFLHVLIYNFISHHITKVAHEKYLFRKAKEKAENRLEVIINAFPDGFFVVSSNNEIEYANLKMLVLLECTQNNLIDSLSLINFCEGKKYSSLTQSNFLIDHINIMFSLDFNQEMMFGISMFNNTSIEWKGSKILWEDKPALVITGRNANHVIELERTIADDKFKTVLLRTVSHELRTPINAISLLTEELIQEPDIADKYKDKIRMISVSARLLLTLVSDLLDYSRMLAGVFSVQKSWFELKDIVERSCELINIQAKKKNISLIIRIDNLIPKCIYSDPLRLSQVLLNLLSNALKFTISGFIEIICLLDMQNNLKVIVQDSGIGIDKEKLQHLFSEFNTCSLPVINPQGCGLGLHISNKIVRELGRSYIEVDSTKGVGSTFHFTISISENPINIKYEYFDIENCVSEEINFLSINLSTIKSNNPQVLIVDDNDMNRAILSSLLARNKIETSEACTGKEAINMVFKQDCIKKPYRVIIMDGEMPELDGWEATKTILDLKEKEKISFMPSIIGYTAYSTDEDIKRCIECGMKECLIKPCSSEILISAILKYL